MAAQMTQTAAESLSQGLSRLAADTPVAVLPDSAVHAFRRAFVDYLACALAGANLPVTEALRGWAVSQASRPVATAIGSGVSLSAPEAAFVNGAAAHGLDFDDGQTRGSVHPGGAIFSAALAAAEREGASLDDFMAGVVLGYDVLLRIAGAMHPASAKLGWHNTPVAGVFGAAAAAARIAHLDAATTAHALGIAASFSGGIRQYLAEGAEVKRLHPGKAARDGLICADLAARGITGAIWCLEGADGLFRAMIGDKADPSQITDAIGDPFLIETAYFKPFPCCRHFHAAIDAALLLREQANLASSDVAGIEIGLYAVGAHGHDHKEAPNILAAQMSAPCAIAGALMKGRLGAADFEPSEFQSAEARRLLDITQVFVDAECEAIYPGTRSGVVTLTLKDGRRIEKRVLDPRGEGSNPLTDADLSRKFLDNASGVLGQDRAAQLLDLLWSAERGGDLPAILRLLSAQPRQRRTM
jgi:2-methylcitrate dehydratase PrpD